MLVNLNEVLKYAKEHNCAIGSFNTPTLESLNAVLNAATKLNIPVIIMHAECHEHEAPLTMIGPIMIMMAKNAKIPVCVHLDHGEHVEYIKRAIDLGFSSVMFDGSSLNYDKNVSLTKEVVKLAHPKNISVEAEIGILGGRESGDKRNLTPDEMYTDPDLAKKFVDDTKIDALACSFGTAHGIYKETPKLDFVRIEKIRKLCNIPLVMHGGSGVPYNDYIKAIKLGIMKINYYSYMARAGVNACKEILKTNVQFFHEVAYYVTQKMEEDVMNAMKVMYFIK